MIAYQARYLLSLARCMQPLVLYMYLAAEAIVGKGDLRLIIEVKSSDIVL